MTQSLCLPLYSSLSVVFNDRYLNIYDNVKLRYDLINCTSGYQNAPFYFGSFPKQKFGHFFVSL